MACNLQSLNNPDISNLSPLSGPNTVSTSAVSERSEAESELVTSAVDHAVPSLLSCLRQAPPTIANRKREVAQNDSNRQRLKAPQSVNDPKSVTQNQQRVKEFSEESLVVLVKKLFCTACQEEVDRSRCSITSVSTTIIDQLLSSIILYYVILWRKW